MSDAWTDRLAGARMQVDQQFDHRVQDSQFSNQEWGLIMTAVEFDIHEPEDPDRAALYADTDQVSEIIPELDKIKEQMGGSPTAVDDGGGGGITGSIKGFFDDLKGEAGGIAGDDSSDQLHEAESLAQEYASELQNYLETQGHWEEIRQAAATESGKSA